MPKELQRWLASIELEELAPLFDQHQVRFRDLPLLTSDDLRDMGVPVGPRRRILHAATSLAAAADQIFEASTSVDGKPVSSAERRQLTVMFCDLVGSTALSAGLDPEDMREIILTYQAAVARSVERFEGHIAKFMGDGVLCYFGYPKAHEDEADRAVRAGLACVVAVNNCSAPSGEKLLARVGIATGLVVVGDLIGDGAAQEEAVVGDTPNLAARIQAMANPGQVLIARATQELLGQEFEIEDLGTQNFKGLDNSEGVFAVSGALDFSDNLEVRNRNAAPMIGRDQELGLLRQRWELAKENEGQAAILMGDAGIGKSRLLRAAIDSLSGEKHHRIGLQCSPYYSESALWPVIQNFKRLAGIAREDEIDIQLDKLERSLANSSMLLTDEARYLVASLLGLDTKRYGSIELAPQIQRSRTLDLLVDLLIGQSSAAPVLLLVEDAHWIDPTTLDLIERCLDKIDKLPILILLTSRPTDNPILETRTRILRLTLSQMSRAGIATIVQNIASASITEAMVSEIVQRSDGIPLFAEELAKSLLTSGETIVPSSLQNSLTARLDRIPEAKKVAQAAACIGRDFEFQLLAEASEFALDDLESYLDQLCSAGVLLRHGSEDSRSFRFSHALVRDVAFESTLHSEKKSQHLRIANVLRTRTRQGKSQEPEIIALHFEEAGMLADAAQFWFAACKQSIARSADREAISHAENALKCNAHNNQSKDQADLDLEILMVYGVALFSLKGWASPETANVFERASSLAEKLGKVEDQFAATWNIWLNKQQSGQVREAQNLVDSVLSFAQKIDDDEVRMEAHHAAWTTGFGFAPLAKLRSHIDQGLELYDVDRHRLCWSRYGGHDAGVCGNGHAAWVAWLEGRVDTAVGYSRAGTDIAKKVDHAYSRLLSLFFACSIDLNRREPQNLIERCTVALCQAEDLGLAQHASIVRVFRGWAITQQGAGDDGLAELKLGLSELDQLNVKHRMTFYLAILSDTCLTAGKVDEGLAAIERAFALLGSLNEIRWKPELLRLQARLLLQGGKPELGLIQSTMRESIATAQEDGSSMFVLRASRDLAQVLTDAGERQQAYDLLRPAYDAITEGRNTVDMLEAKTILAGLSELPVRSR